MVRSDRPVWLKFVEQPALSDISRFERAFSCITGSQPEAPGAPGE